MHPGSSCFVVAVISRGTEGPSVSRGLDELRHEASRGGAVGSVGQQDEAPRLTSRTSPEKVFCFLLARGTNGLPHAKGKRSQIEGKYNRFQSIGLEFFIKSACVFFKTFSPGEGSPFQVIDRVAP